MDDQAGQQVARETGQWPPVMKHWKILLNIDSKKNRQTEKLKRQGTVASLFAGLWTSDILIGAVCPLSQLVFERKAEDGQFYLHE